MGGKSSTTTQKTELPPDIVAAYDKLLAQAQPVSQTPYQPYTGGFTPDEQAGFSQIDALRDVSTPYYQNAANDLAASVNPAYNQVGNYMNPYIGGVVRAATANMNEQNQEQQQSVLGNAASLGALGGDRVGVAQGELARQQALSNNQNISNILEQGYGQALSAAQAQQGYMQNAAYGELGIGKTAMQTGLAQAAAQVGAGTQQQQWDYQQYQNSLSYPFETNSWMANIVEGLGAGRGTTTTTQPNGNSGSAVLGGVLSLASLLNKGGVVHANDDRPRRAPGGVVPYATDPSGIINSGAANNNNPMGANDNGYVPAVAASMMAGPARPQAVPQQPDQGNAMLQQGLKAEEGSLAKRFPNGIIAGMGPGAAPMQGPTLSGAPLGAPALQNQGLFARLGGLLGFADGGVARKGYDIGGGVDYPDPIDNPAGLSTGELLSLLGPTSPPPVTAAPVAAPVAPVRYPTVAQDQNYTYANELPPGPAPGPGILSTVGDAVRGNMADFANNAHSLDTSLGAPTLGRGVPNPGVIIPNETYPTIAQDQPYSPMANGLVPRPSLAAVDGAPVSMPYATMPTGSDIPVPTMRPPYTDPQVSAYNGTSPLAGMNAGVVRNPDGSVSPTTANGVPGQGNNYFPPAPAAPNAALPTTTAAARGVRVNTAAQPIYDEYMNTIRSGYTDPITGKYVPGITNPYGLAAVATTGLHESGFSPRNASGTWADPDASGRGIAGGIMSYADNSGGRRLSNLKAFVAARGGTGIGTPTQQAQFFLSERPQLVSQLNATKSPQESAQLMAANWGFKGWNQPGGEAQRRLNQTAALAPQFQNNGGIGASTTATANVGPQGDGTGNVVDKAPAAAAATDSSTASNSGNQGVIGGGATPHEGTLGGTGPGGSHGLLSMMGGGAHGLPISDDQRMALLAAGLGMMAGTSPHASQNIGAGGLKGLDQWKINQEQNRANAETASQINYRAGDLGLTGEGLGLRAQQVASEVKLQTAQAAREAQLTQTERWDVTPTNVGFVVRDKTNPNAPPKIIPYPDQDGTPAAGGSGGGGNGAAANPGGGAATTTTAASQPQNAPVTAAPVTPVGVPYSPNAPSIAAAASATPSSTSTAAPAAPATVAQQTSAAAADTNGPDTNEVDTELPKKMPFNYMTMTPEGKEMMREQGNKEVEQANGDYKASQNMILKLKQVQDAMAQLPKSGLLTQGAGLQYKTAAVKGINSLLAMMGQPQIDPNAVGSVEELNKLTTQLGFEFSRTLGNSREAASIVNQAVGAVPSGEMTVAGSKKIIAGMTAAAERNIDYYTMLTKWQRRYGGDTTGADVYFNQRNPPEKYLRKYQVLGAEPAATPDNTDPFGIHKKTGTP